MTSRQPSRRSLTSVLRRPRRDPSTETLGENEAPDAPAGNPEDRWDVRLAPHTATARPGSMLSTVGPFVGRCWPRGPAHNRMAVVDTPSRLTRTFFPQQEIHGGRRSISPPLRSRHRRAAGPQPTNPAALVRWRRRRLWGGSGRDGRGFRTATYPAPSRSPEGGYSAAELRDSCSAGRACHMRRSCRSGKMGALPNHRGSLLPRCGSSRPRAGCDASLSAFMLRFDHLAVAVSGIRGRETETAREGSCGRAVWGIQTPARPAVERPRVAKLGRHGRMRRQIRRPAPRVGWFQYCEGG